MGEIYALKTNHVTNPIGYYMDRVVISWKVRDCKGIRQSAVRLMVSRDVQFQEILFDEQSADYDSCGTIIPLKLEPYTRYYWKVMVTTDVEEVLESEIQYFETAKMEEPWAGQWIGCDNTKSRHPIFYKDIIPKEEVSSARLYITGLGLYEAYFAKDKEAPVKIGGEYLTPYCNNYSQWIQYQTYDITDVLQGGGRLSVMLGNGWYKGRFGFNSTTADEGVYGNQWKLLGEIHLTYQDGSKEVIPTDESWLVARSNITFSNIYDGEWRDDTLGTVEEVPAVATEAPEGRLMERLSLPVVEQERMDARELIHTPAQETVFDLGQEITGTFRIHIQEPVGTEIVIQTGEVLQDGCFYNGNLRSARSEYRYISDGVEKDITPQFTFYGYRYVRVTGCTHLNLDDFQGIVLHSDFDWTGELITGNELVNQFISNVKWGMKGNFLDVPTDCPQRDERMGWTGDAQVFSNTAGYLADTYAFYRKYLYDLHQEQLLRDGMVPEVVPTFGDTKTSAAWGDAACIIPWNLYLQYGDKSILEQQYNSMKDWVDYISRQDGTCHGWRQSFHYGDWLALDRVGANDKNVYGATDEAYIADIYYAASLELVAKTAGILGQEADARHYKKLTKSQWQIVRDEYFTKTGRCAINTQTGLVLALKYHLSQDEELTRRMLRKQLRNSKYKLNTGFVGTPLLNKVLTENGMEHEAYGLLLNEEYPGWLYEVKHGATTVWERWNSIDEDGRISSSGMNSLNHYSYGSVLEWVYQSVGGIHLTEDSPGGRCIRIQPLVHWKLGGARVCYDSACGRYESGWEILEGNQIKIHISVPFGGSARVILPMAPEAIYSKTDNGLLHDVRHGVCYISAGEYEIIYPAKEPLRQVYTCDSRMEELLENPEVRHFLETMVEVDSIPDGAYDMSLRQTAETFSGPVAEEQIMQLNLALAQF